MKYTAISNTRLAAVATVAAGIFAVSALHEITPPTMLSWHNVFQHLYNIPIVVAALSFGWPGGLIAALLAGISNLPYIIKINDILPSSAVNQAWDIPLFCAIGIVAGVLAERGQNQRAALERTTQRLTEVYQELQDNFERMKRAERLFALGQLSAGLAHEIRNPLASIAGAAGILRRTPRLTEADAECLEIIGKECRRLQHLLTHFLAFARPRTPAYQDTDLAAMIASVVELATHAIGDRPVQLRKVVSPEVPVIECDPELLNQVLLNLVINAVQAMPEGGEVLVWARMRDERLQIDVRDEGEGISTEIRDRIFDPFFTTKSNGTGLGLSVAHQIIEQHGGILTAENNRGKGMTFSVVLPIRRERQYGA